MEVDNRMKAYLLLQGNLLIDESARLVNRNLDGDIKQASVIQLFKYLFEHCKYEKSYYALLSFIPRSPLHSYQTFAKDFELLKNKLGNLYTDDSPLVQCVTNLTRIIILRKKLVDVLPKLKHSIDYFEQVDITKTEAYDLLFNTKTQYEEKRVEEIDEVSNICLVPLKRNILNELRLLRKLTECSVMLQKKEYQEMGKLQEECTMILLQWKELVLSELEGCNDLIPNALKTFTHYPFFKWIRDWINAVGDLANILGNCQIHSNYFRSIINDFLDENMMFMYFQNGSNGDSLETKLSVPPEANIVYGEMVTEYLKHNALVYDRTFYQQQDLSLNSNNIVLYIFTKKNEIFVIVVQSNKLLKRNEIIFDFMEKLMDDMFCFKSIFG